VAGTPDQVDVVVNVKERSSGQFTFGLGYSQIGKLITSVQLDQANFLGTGNRVGVGIQKNSYSKSFNFSFQDPYFTEDGVSVGYNVRYSDYDFGDFNTARYTSSDAAGEAVIGIPLSETDSIQFALGLDRNQLTTTDGSTPPQLVDYMIDTLGDRERYFSTLGDSPISFHENDDRLTDPTGSLTPSENDDEDPNTTDPLQYRYGPNRKWIINAWRAQIGWARDSRNDFLMPTRGTYNRLHGEFVLPGSDLEYYKLSYSFEHYLSINRWLVLKIGTELGYGDSYGDTADRLCYERDDDNVAIIETGEKCGLPFFKNFFAGGPQSVRGFETNTLGPFYQVGNLSLRQPLGGAVKATGTFEFLFPTLFDSRGTRLSAFVDYGNVFASPRDVELREFRFSAGVALQWQSPMGPIGISWAMPFQTDRNDRVERLQFSFGGQF
ncbi:MAG TPA: outer membrane protein assembly factor BamA, partial [Arenimonas sp.]|nr:outer membrane protein assembly factor BamA [Arenimonas sp.]